MAIVYHAWQKLQKVGPHRFVQLSVIPFIPDGNDNAVCVPRWLGLDLEFVPSSMIRLDPGKSHQSWGLQQ